MKAFDLKREDFKSESDFWSAKFKHSEKERWRLFKLKILMPDELRVSVNKYFTSSIVHLN